MDHVWLTYSHVYHSRGWEEVRDDGWESKPRRVRVWSNYRVCEGFSWTDPEKLREIIRWSVRYLVIFVFYSFDRWRSMCIWVTIARWWRWRCAQHFEWSPGLTYWQAGQCSLHGHLQAPNQPVCPSTGHSVPCPGCQEEHPICPSAKKSTWSTCYRQQSSTSSGHVSNSWIG